MPSVLLQSADELLALATEHGLGFYRAFALIERGWCLTAMGRADEGIPVIAAGVDGVAKLGMPRSSTSQRRGASRRRQRNYGFRPICCGSSATCY
jgi:hypothetical protein